MYALVSAFVAGFAVGPPLLSPLPSMRSHVRPAMILDVVPEIDVPSILLAKTEADELLDDIISSVPIAVTGGLLALFASEYAKNLKPLSTPLPDFIPELPELPELPSVPEEYSGLASTALIPVGAVAFLLAAKVGLLGGFAGLLAKSSLDAWNVFASIVLKGAYLKYQ